MIHLKNTKKSPQMSQNDYNLIQLNQSPLIHVFNNICLDGKAILKFQYLVH